MYTWNLIQEYHVQSSIQQEEGSFRQGIGLEFKEDATKVLYLELSFVWCWKLDTSESRSEIPTKFRNVFLVKDEEDQFGLSSENDEVLHRVNQKGNIVQAMSRMRAIWVGHVLRRNCLLK